MKEEIAVSILVVFKLEEEAHSFKEMLKETYIYSMKPYGRNIFLHLFMPKRHLKKKMYGYCVQSDKLYLQQRKNKLEYLKIILE